MGRSATSLLRDAKKRRAGNAVKNGGLRIGIVGTATTQYFALALEQVLHERGIEAETYEGGYDSITAEALDGGSGLHAFGPSIVIVLPHHTDIAAWPAMLASPDEVEAALDTEVSRWRGLWGALGDGGSHILQANYVAPLETQLGNLECNYGFSASSYVAALNARLVSERPQSVTFVDMEALASRVGKERWFDNAAYFMAKMPYGMDCLPRVAELFARQVEALEGRMRKCLALDLDNTLWGGVVGDDGADGIMLDPNDAVGEAYRHFQGYVKGLKERGVALAVCSKNDEDVAKGAFRENRYMVLGLDDIACFVANWDDKASNIRAIAAELNIGLDSIVFCDDNPAERAIVKDCLPEVHVVDMPEDPADFARRLDEEAPFDWAALTREDLSRSDTYVGNAKRSELEVEAVDYEGYLESLAMEGGVSEVGPSDMRRFVQLVNKTNQFNLNGVRLTDAEAEGARESGDCVCLKVELTDRFGDYGTIGCAICRVRGDALSVETWVMSCRVFKRGVEHMTLSAMVEAARMRGCDRVECLYADTGRNPLVRDFLLGAGFAPGEEPGQASSYVLPIERYSPKAHHIRTTKEDG